MDIFSVLSLIGGLALFLYGMDLMGDSLKKIAGGKLESILARLTSTKWKGFLLGLVVTAIIQSSSATTVMLVGFVNSGIMKLGQTMSIILGANVGTTVTAWLLSTAEIQGVGFILKLLKPDSFTPILALIGLLMTMTAKDDRKKNFGCIFLGFAILMFGMDSMSGAVEGLRDNQTFTNLLTMFSNPLMGILVGTVFTAIIQSSSASVGVLQALALSCAIPYSTAIPVILGQNIGTTITPILSSISGNTESKRVAVSCLYIKMIGVIVVTGIFYAIHALFPFSFMQENVGALEIAFVHTLFNVLSTVILIPFTSLIERLAIRTVRGKKDESTEADPFAVLDERFLAMPSFAVEKCKDLVCDMARISLDSFDKATALLDDYSEAQFQEVDKLEGTVDRYEDKTSTYLVKIAKSQMSSRDSKVVTELLHCIGDIERISDHALNIAETAKEISDKEISFSDKAKEDIAVITAAVSEVLRLATDALIRDDLAIAAQVEPLEQVIDNLKRKIKNGHINRLRQGDCTMEMGFILSDLLTNYERIADHCSNIAVCFLEMSHGSFATHEYLNRLKTGQEENFARLFDNYAEKYQIQ